MFGFYLKKTLSRVFFPVPLCLGILVAGIVCLWFFPHRQKLGKVLVSIGTILLFAFSWGPVSSRLLGPIEHEYPSLDPDGLDPDAGYAILVLGQGMSQDSRLPPGQRVNETFMARLVEGIRVFRKLSKREVEVELFVSMSGLAPVGDKRAFLQTFAETVALNPGEFQFFTDGKDTEEELAATARRCPGARIVVVSSASHIPRAMMICRRLGIEAIAAPTVPECQTGPSRIWSWAPKARSLYRTERAVYERLGMGWEWLKSALAKRPEGQETESGGDTKRARSRADDHPDPLTAHVPRRERFTFPDGS